MNTKAARSGWPDRIVVLGTRGFPNVQGGVEKHCENLTVNLVKMGTDVIVFTRKPYVNSRIQVYRGVKTIPLPAVRQKNLETFLHSLVGVFCARKYKPDILHLQAIGPALFVPLAKALKMKVVVTSHGSNYEHIKWGWLGKLALRLGEFCGVKFADEVIAVSARIACEIADRYHRNCVIIPNGVQLAGDFRERGLLPKYGLRHATYILAVGRLVPEKGFDVLIEAFKQLSIKKWKLVIVGSADHEGGYSKRLKERGGRVPGVVFTGFLDEFQLAEIYRHAGIFVLPSYYEGLPITLLEALGYGLSCIVSDIKGNRNIPLEEARYFEPGDSHGLAQKLLDYIEKPLTMDEQERQRSTILSAYSWESVARQTMAVYRNVLTDRKICAINASSVSSMTHRSGS